MDSKTWRYVSTLMIIFLAIAYISGIAAILGVRDAIGFFYASALLGIGTILVGLAVSVFKSFD